LTLEGKPEEHKLAPGEGAEAAATGAGERRGRFSGQDRRDGDRTGRPGRGGAPDSRVYTVESEKAVAETKGRKGELTSLSGLRALLSRREDPPAGGDSGNPA